MFSYENYKIFFKEREETIMKTLKTLKNALSYALGYVTVLGIAVLLIGLRKMREKFWTIVGRFLYRIGYLKD